VPVQAYVNFGRWVADCACASAEELKPRQQLFHCSGCKQLAEIAWPPDADEIGDALSTRPLANRNWSPAGHRQSHACGVPDGQTVAELKAETATYLGGK